MATLGIYRHCIAVNKKLGRHNLKTGSYAPPMEFLFKEKRLVTKSQFRRLSKEEQRRHLTEDRILVTFYLEEEMQILKTVK